MKKVWLTIALFCVCFSMFSQETEKIKSEAKNEIKVNLLMTLFSFPDISYERILGNSFGFGLSAGIPIENDFDTKYRILPYSRFYFGESLIKSFFIEANIGIEGYKKYSYSWSENYSHSETKNALDLGIGVAVGYKYVNSKDFIGELFLGVGRTSNDRAYPRVGISIGKQF